MARIRKKMKIDRSCLDLAYERINKAFDLYDTVDVSFSGGKDSTACLNLTLEVARQRGKLPLRVFFHDEEAIPLQTSEYAERVSQNPDIAFEWYCLPVKHRNACSRQHPWWSPWDLDEQDLWVRDLPAKAIQTLKGFDTGGEPRDRLSIPDMNGLLHDPAIYGTVGMIMGIRGQESMTRQRAVSIKKEENYLIHYKDGPSNLGNVWKVYPIYDWQTEDVWTAPKLFGWDYNHAYDVMDQCGISAYKQRCSPAYGEEPMQGFHLFKKCFPEVWDKMSTRVPGANTAYLYARTEVYGSGTLLLKPDHMTWEAFVMNYIEMFAEEERPIVANGVRRVINEHYNKTTDPILSEYDHPVTGVSWRHIANIAFRGDFKARRAQKMTSYGAIAKGKDIDVAFEEYHEARVKEGL